MGEACVCLCVCVCTLKVKTREQQKQQALLLLQVPETLRAVHATQGHIAQMGNAGATMRASRKQSDNGEGMRKRMSQTEK